MFHTNEDIHSYLNRQRSNFHIFQGRTSMVHKTFRYKGEHIWNELLGYVDYRGI